MRLAAIAAIATTVVLAGCGGGDAPEPARDGTATPPAGDAAPATHVHGIGVDSGRTYVATHDGLLVDGRRVGPRQDLMGFTVAAPGVLLASGHPGPEQRDEPPNLGLLRSTDGGRSWRSVSLKGEADFHALAAAGDHVAGFDGGLGRLRTSDDGGRTWRERATPGAVLSLALDPQAPRRVVASTSVGVAVSQDAGATWSVADPALVGLLAWGDDALHLAGPDGALSRSADGGRTWSPAGAIGAPPVAVAADGAGVVAALEDGSVRRVPAG